MPKVPPSFVDEGLWPEVVALEAALAASLVAVTQKIIRAEVLGEATDTADPLRRR